MHHIKSDILTFHLSPILPELRWRVLRYVWLNPRMSQWVQWFFFASIGGVRWLRPSAARSQHARNRASTWKAANCVWFPDFVSGLQSGEDCPVLPMRWSVHWYRSDRAGVWSQISNSRQFLLQQSFPQIEG